MIAVDTQILVYAHRADAEFHSAALKRMVELAEGVSQWAIPWPCIHEYLAIVTHGRIYRPPTPALAAVQAIQVWTESPYCKVIGEGPGYLALLEKIIRAARVTGGAVHDARVAAICIHHGVTTLWTADRDFSRFGDLTTQNPPA